ncbi:MAG: tetratricopeptide repeat protein [Oscillospiraceae bacterium]|nr:tetratricopeptide repeat protein [Oscillospiraceae bacterium]
MEFNYDVFFSYRHRPLDGEITQKTFNAIESYKLPQAIRAMGCPEIRRAFRDTEELPVSRILTDTIDRALHSTNCLVVVCSTDTPSSEWIDREVQTFIEIGRASHIYPLLISGDPEHSFPPSLKLVPDVMERVMDIRVPGNNVKKMMAKEETELLRVIAGIVGCKEEELLREHKLRKSKRFAARALGAAAVFALVAGVSLGLMNLAQEYRDTAAARETASMRILNELTYDLPDHLTNIPGAYSRIADILEQNTRDINAIIRLSVNSESAEMEAAANLEKLANAGTVLGRLDEALRAEEEAIGIYRTLAETGTGGAQTALASAENNRGGILNAMGRYEEADEAFESAVAQLRAQGEPDRLILAQALFNTGANAVNRGDSERAAAAFEESLQLLGALEEDAQTLESLAKVNYNYGVQLYRSGDYGQAEEKLAAACTYGEKLLAQADSLNNRHSYVRSTSTLAAVLTDQGQYERADAVYELAIAAAKELAADAENTENQRNLAELYNNRALCFNIQGRYRDADALYRESSELRGALYETTGAASDGAQYALTLLNLGENAFKIPDYARSREYFEKGLRQYGDVLAELGDYDEAQYDAWRSYYLLIHQHDFEGALNTAMAGYELQPNNVLVNMNLAYAALYTGYWDDADMILTQIAALGGGQADTIRRDLEAQRQSGLETEHLEDLLALLKAYD